MMEQRIRACYEIVSALPPAQTAEIIAGEQSTGTFTRIPGETDELRERHGARVESVTETRRSGGRGFARAGDERLPGRTMVTRSS